ncbi:MAG: putative quinol monooxygenase [Chloroflexota bacterium]
MIVLVVSVQVKPGRRDEFIEVIREDAENTTMREDGNFQFNVVQDNADPDHFFLYEVYRDQAAFEAHRQMPHFLKYRKATENIYVSEPVRTIGTNLYPSDADWLGDD